MYGDGFDEREEGFASDLAVTIETDIYFLEEK